MNKLNIAILFSSVFFCCISNTAEKQDLIPQIQNLSLVDDTAKNNWKPRSYQQLCHKHATTNPRVLMNFGHHQSIINKIVETPTLQLITNKKGRFSFILFAVSPEQTKKLCDMHNEIYQKLSSNDHNRIKNIQKTLNEYVLFCDEHGLWSLPLSIRFDELYPTDFYFPEDLIKKLKKDPMSRHLNIIKREWEHILNNNMLKYFITTEKQIKVTRAMIATHGTLTKCAKDGLYKYDTNKKKFIKADEMVQKLDNKCEQIKNSIVTTRLLSNLNHKRFSSLLTVKQWYKNLISDEKEIIK